MSNFLITCHVRGEINSCFRHMFVSTTQKMKFSIKDFFSKCDQILNGKLQFLRNVLS